MIVFGDFRLFVILSFLLGDSRLLFQGYPGCLSADALDVHPRFVLHTPEQLMTGDLLTEF